MATYLYCLFRERVDPPAKLAGVSGTPVRAVANATLGAWVSSVPEVPGATANSLRDHDDVTNAGLATGFTPLPVRFGETFESDEVCLTSLAAREVELVESLRRVEGRVEMTIAVPLHPAADPAHVQPVDASRPGPGRAYLERLRGPMQDAQLLQQQGHVITRPVVHAVRGIVIDERATLRSAPPTYLLSHLIARESVDEYRRLVTAAIGTHEAEPGGHALIRGPSAPYSFTTAHK